MNQVQTDRFLSDRRPFLGNAAKIQDEHFSARSFRQESPQPLDTVTNPFPENQQNTARRFQLFHVVDISALPCGWFHREANTDYMKCWQPFLELPAKHSAKTSACPCQPLAWRPTLTTWNTDDRSWSCQQNSAKISACSRQPVIERPTLHTTWNTYNGSCRFQKNTVWRFQHVHISL